MAIEANGMERWFFGLLTGNLVLQCYDREYTIGDGHSLSGTSGGLNRFF
jgi:hypothetical protein